MTYKLDGLTYTCNNCGVTAAGPLDHIKSPDGWAGLPAPLPPESGDVWRFRDGMISFYGREENWSPDGAHYCADCVAAGRRAISDALFARSNPPHREVEQTTAEALRRVDAEREATLDRLRKASSS